MARSLGWVLGTWALAVGGLFGGLGSCGEEEGGSCAWTWGSCEVPSDCSFQSWCDPYTSCEACPGECNGRMALACESGACVAVEVEMHTVAECGVDEDCRLRRTTCCEEDSLGGFCDLVAIGVEAEAEFEALVCDPQQACEDAEATYPGVVVECIEGRCGWRQG